MMVYGKPLWGKEPCNGTILLLTENPSGVKTSENSHYNSLVYNQNHCNALRFGRYAEWVGDTAGDDPGDLVG